MKTSILLFLFALGILLPPGLSRSIGLHGKGFLKSFPISWRSRMLNPVNHTGEVYYRMNTDTLRYQPDSLLHPDWLRGAADYRLPAWFDSHRVQLHTRLSPNWFDKEQFYQANQGFQQMGARVITRHIKTGDEGAWWPSKVGQIHPAVQKKNIAKEIIDDAHQRGMRIIAYHRHMEDKGMADAHPDWICRDEKGNPYQRRGLMMCFNSPYADFFLTRALELTELGADGFYFDEVHMPKQGCWCSYCKEKFKRETGLEHPARMDPSDPVWHTLKDFTNATIEQTFVRYRRELHKKNPEVVLLISSNTWPGMADRHMTNRLIRIADAHKTEFTLPVKSLKSDNLYKVPEGMAPLIKRVKVAHGYLLARDAADGRPPHVWVHALPDEISALYATSGVMAHGGIANLDVPESSIPNAMFKSSLELGKKVSPYLAGSQPVRWAALHYSEYAKDKYALQGGQVWTKILYPNYGAFMGLFQKHVPVGFVTDSQLEEGRLKNYAVLFITDQSSLTEKMRQAIRAFEAGGGKVIYNREAWKWHHPEQQPEAVNAFISSLGSTITKAPVQVLTDSPSMQSNSFYQNSLDQLAITCVNDFSWINTSNVVDDQKVEDSSATPVGLPAACENVKILLRGKFNRNPARVFDAVSGQSLSFSRTKKELRVKVPRFDYLAVVVVKY